MERLAAPARRRRPRPTLDASSTPRSRNAARRCATRCGGSGFADGGRAALADRGRRPGRAARDARPRGVRPASRRPCRAMITRRRPREAQRVPPGARPARRRLPRHRDGDPAAGPARRRHGRAGRRARGRRRRARGRPSSPAPAGSRSSSARRSAWAAATGRPDPGARITVEKRIPVAAGLGGGSADAAATILALDELHGTDLDAETQLGIAAAVGSDVPALLLGGPVYAAGRGERGHPGARA